MTYVARQLRGSNMLPVLIGAKFNVGNERIEFTKK